ncbi:hypothetical protein N789_09880 [Arenimonas oryziterrae DSM 21050 = YC6267]|uniref:Uncharacterized protein n=1 Tax=Arenimonas oryziterrae DSM 21050 = YC6267 TaxID=1121015 RepID=A0A091AY56_9GAMM|nr:hypothetical protein N789_09880 [Arenimonas oryziterrae DSM 21050 = YC6267]
MAPGDTLKSLKMQDLAGSAIMAGFNQLPGSS